MSHAREAVVVIGAGVIGASIALELQRGGRRVTVVDKGSAVGAGSTSSSSSIIRFTYSTPEGVAAAWEAMHRWRAWSEHLGPVEGPLCRFHRIGMLHIPSPGERLEGMRATFDDIGLRYEWLDREAIAARWPALDTGCYFPPRLPSDDRFFDGAHGAIEALFTPDAGMVDDPRLAAQNLVDAARRHGTRVRLRQQVVDVVRDDGRVRGVVLATGETIDAGVVVNAAGPWSSRVNHLAGVTGEMRISTRAMRQEVAATPAPPAFAAETGGCVIGDLDLGIYGRPQPGGSFLIGGVEADCDPCVWVDDPDTANPHISPEMFQTLSYRAARRLPDLEVPNAPRGLADHYDVTEDWIPIYDRSGLDGYYMAIGTSGNQFKNAPLVGDIMKALIEGCEAGHDHDRRPISLTCSHTGLVLDLGHYSRLRVPRATSGTVMG